MSPAYLRVPLTQRFFPSNITEQYSNYEINTADWKKFYDWIKMLGLTPVFAIPYNPNHWQPKHVLQLLGTAYKLGMNNCVWTLGIDFNGTTAKKYSDDIHTFALMINSFPQHKTNWTISSADISFGSDPSEIKVFTQLVEDTVDAVGWIEPTELNSDESIIYHDAALTTATQSEIPVWLSVTMPQQKSRDYSTCGEACIADGMEWATILGYAGKTGFSAVFKTLQISEVHQTTFSYYISLIHKKTVGWKMFETKLKQGEKHSSKFYSYCSASSPGSITIMGINNAETKCKISPNLGTKFNANQIQQYILSVQDGLVYLNNDPISRNETQLDPFTKSKRGSSQIILTLPPFSVGFWELSYGNFKECLNNIDENLIKSRKNPPTSSQTSIDLLLQDLIWNSINDENRLDSNRRTKRSIEDRQFNKLFSNLKSNHPPQLSLKEKLNLKEKLRNKIDLNGKDRNRRFVLSPEFNHHRNIENIEDRSTFKLKDIFTKPLIHHKKENILGGAPILRRRFKRELNFPHLINLPKFKLPEKKIIPPPFKSHRISEEKIFGARENPNIPEGDVYLTVGNGEEDQIAAEMVDYVDFDDNARNVPSFHDGYHDERLEEIPDVSTHLAYAPNEFYEQFPKEYILNNPKRLDNGPNLHRELWEMENRGNISPDGKSHHATQQYINHENDKHFDYVVRELEPTWQQNYDNLRKTSEKMKTFYVEVPVEENKFGGNINRGGLFKLQNKKPYDDLQRHHFAQEFEDEEENSEDDDQFYLRRDQRLQQFNPSWRIKREINTSNNKNHEHHHHHDDEFHTKNQIINAIEKMVESLEDDYGIEIESIEKKYKHPKKFFEENKKNEIIKTKVKRSLEIYDPTRYYKLPQIDPFKELVGPVELASFNKPPFEKEIDKNLPKLHQTIIESVEPLDLQLLHRNKRSLTSESSSWESHEKYNTITKEMSNENTNFIRLIPEINENVESAAGPTISKSVIEDGLKKIEQAKEKQKQDEGYYHHVKHFVKNVSRSFGDLIEKSHKHIAGWWHIFS